MGGTFKGFGVIYIGLIDLHRAGEFKTSLVNTVYTAFSCVGCEYDMRIESHSEWTGTLEANHIFRDISSCQPNLIEGTRDPSRIFFFLFLCISFLEIVTNTMGRVVPPSAKFWIRHWLIQSFEPISYFVVNFIYRQSFFSAVFTGWLSDRYPLRILVLIGATLSMIGFVMSDFAPNIYVVIAGYGVITVWLLYSIATFKLSKETKHKYRVQETFALSVK